MTARAITLASLLSTALIATAASAKPWQGITPGQSKKAEVLKAIGPPTKTESGEKEKTGKGKSKIAEILVYTGIQAPPGSRQAQVKLDDKGVVTRIDVYPGLSLDAEQIEGSYGAWCKADEPTDPCYDKKSSSKGDYWLYNELGLAVFWNDRKVEQLVFLPGKKKAAKRARSDDDDSGGSDSSDE